MGNIWLGLYRTRGDGVFVWSDQRSSSFRKWKSGQPNTQLCVNVYDGYWYDRNCEDYAPFACYIGEFLFNVYPYFDFSFYLF